jgi:hypothetical protein
MADKNTPKENNEKTFLSVDEILALDDLDVVPIYIPEWKTHVRFRVMSAAQALTFQKTLDNPSTKADAWIRIFAYCAVDENGKRMFSDQQLQQLREKSTRVFLRLQDELMRINGFKDDIKDELKNGSGEASPDASPSN